MATRVPQVCAMFGLFLSEVSKDVCSVNGLTKPISCVMWTNRK